MNMAFIYRCGRREETQREVGGERTRKVHRNSKVLGHPESGVRTRQNASRGLGRRLGVHYGRPVDELCEFCTLRAGLQCRGGLEVAPRIALKSSLPPLEPVHLISDLDPNNPRSARSIAADHGSDEIGSISANER